MDLPGSIDAWIMEARDIISQLDPLIAEGERLKMGLEHIPSPGGATVASKTSTLANGKLFNDIDFVTLQVDKALRGMTEIKKKLEMRIKQLEEEKRETMNRQAHEREGPRRLRTVIYRGKTYTHDPRLNQFRYMELGKRPEFVDPGTPLFSELMMALEDQLPPNEKTRTYSVNKRSTSRDDRWTS